MARLRVRTLLSRCDLILEASLRHRIETPRNITRGHRMTSSSSTRSTCLLVIPEAFVSMLEGVTAPLTLEEVHGNERIVVDCLGPRAVQLWLVDLGAWPRQWVRSPADDVVLHPLALELFGFLFRLEACIADGLVYPCNHVLRKLHGSKDPVPVLIGEGRKLVPLVDKREQVLREALDVKAGRGAELLHLAVSLEVAVDGTR